MWRLISCYTETIYLGGHRVGVSLSLPETDTNLHFKLEVIGSAGSDVSVKVVILTESLHRHYIAHRSYTERVYNSLPEVAAYLATRGLPPIYDINIVHESEFWDSETLIHRRRVIEDLVRNNFRKPVYREHVLRPNIMNYTTRMKHSFLSDVVDRIRELDEYARPLFK